MPTSQSASFLPLTIDGGKPINNRTLDKMILSATYSLTMGEQSDMTFVLHDPNHAYLSSFAGDRGPIGKSASYNGYPLAVASLSASGGSSGLGETSLSLRPDGIEKLRKVKGGLNRPNISATQYVKDAVTRQGMKFVGQPTTPRPSIERDTPGGLGAEEDRNEWTTIKGLAGEEQFVVFELQNTIYFAKPQWLFDNRPNVKVYWAPTSQWQQSDRWNVMLSAPTIDFGSQNTEDEIQFTLPLQAQGAILPGHTVTVVGVPKVPAKLLVTEVTYPVAGDGVLEVTAKKPWVVEKRERTQPKPPPMSIGGGSGSGGLSMGPGGKGQRFYASEICMAAKQRNLGRDGARNGIATALVESGLRMYANYAVPESLKYPHDAVGSDHDSVGLFQQRQAGWGTLAQRMNPRASAGLFFNKMMTFNWRAMDPGAACQRVQVSAFPGRYSQRMGEAVSIVNQVY